MAGDDWINIQLGDVCSKIGSGATPRGGASVYLEAGEIALIRSQNVYNEGFRREGLAHISEEHAEQLSNVEVQPHDVLLNITGHSVARCCQVHPAVLPARVNQHVSIIRPDHKQLDARFLRYFMVSPQMQGMMLSWAGAGGTRKALTKGMIESFQIFAPEDVTEQQAIACILGTLDDKIELNRRMNETLEQMAQAIFKSWFVDFDPVRAKAASEQPTGLAPHIADLFPDTLEESELGEIPKGWRIDAITAIGDLLSGGTPSTKVPDYWGGGIKWVSAKDVSSAHGTFLLNAERTITQAGVDNSSTRILPELTTIVTARGTVGTYCILAEPMAMNQTNYGLKAKDKGADYFVFFALGHLVSQLKQRAYGTIFDTVTTRTFETSEIVVPGDVVITQFDRHVQPLMEKIRDNLRQSRTLAALRDTLLPKLMSGEVRVKYL